MIITVANFKGGTGKTTTTIYLATVLMRMRFPVQVWDLDRQGSAYEWSDRAREDGSQLGFSVDVVIPRQLHNLKQSLNQKDYVLVDTPPGDVKAIDAGIAVADFVVVTTGSRAADMSRVWEIIQTLGTTPYGVLLTQIRTGTASLREAHDALKENGASFFESTIPLREGIARSFGKPPGNDLFGYEEVAQELLEGIS